MTFDPVITFALGTIAGILLHAWWQKDLRT
jgi:hypothetical protein